LVVVGGEGTYNEVLNGVSFKGMITLGYVPAGFRNALSKGFQSYVKVNGQIKRVLHPKYYRMMNYGVLTSGGDEIFNRRFGGRCGIGLDAAICHNLLCSSARTQMGRFRMNRMLQFCIGMKQLALAKPVKGYIIFDQTKRVEFNHLYFVTFHVCGDDQKKKKNVPEHLDSDSSKMKVYVANSSKKSNMVPILKDVVMGVRKKERGVRVYECNEASVHLNRPLAVHVDGESCMCQQDMEIRCIPKRIRVIGS
jgi:diacylglycerol kinase family enzyme